MAGSDIAAPAAGPKAPRLIDGTVNALSRFFPRWDDARPCKEQWQPHQPRPGKRDHEEAVGKSSIFFHTPLAALDDSRPP